MQGIETTNAAVPTTRVSLCLTRALRLDAAACDTVLRTLVDAGYLRLTVGGYMRG